MSRLLGWFLSTDAVVGRGHATLTDTINRALRGLLTLCGFDPDGEFTGFQSVFNVSAYANGVDILNGVNDGLTAFNAAMAAAAAAGGGQVVIGKGTLKVSATPTYPVGVPIRIKGAGRFRSKIKHATGGRVLDWTFSHINAEFGCGIEDITFDGNGSATAASVITNATLFCMRRTHFTNSLGVGSALSLVSSWDSEYANVYCEDGGDATHPVVTFDTLATGGFNGNSFNNNSFHDFHVETSNVDAIFLDCIGNATNGLDSNRFFGLKLHGNAASGNPARPLLRLSQYTSINSFSASIFAYGRGTCQVQDDGTRNEFFYATFGIGSSGGFNPTYAIQCTANSNQSVWHSPTFSAPQLYATPNVVMRVDAGSIHNKLLWPKGNFSTVANPMSDAGGRSACLWDDLATNRGVKFYFGEGFQWVSTQVMHPHVDLAWAAGNISVPNFQTETYFLNATSNVAATLAAPTSPPQTGQVQIIRFVIRNTSGGALGTAIAFSNAANGYKVSGTVSPANNTQISVTFAWDSNQSLWIEVARSAQV